MLPTLQPFHNADKSVLPDGRGTTIIIKLTRSGARKWCQRRGLDKCLRSVVVISRTTSRGPGFTVCQVIVNLVRIKYYLIKKLCSTCLPQCSNGLMISLFWDPCPYEVMIKLEKLLSEQQREQLTDEQTIYWK